MDASSETTTVGLIPTHWPGQGDLIAFCQNMGGGLAALLILVGLIYLLFGYHIFKILVMVNAAVFGAYIGAIVGNAFGHSIPGAVLGGFSAAAITWPLMKWAVAVMGGVFGAILGASLWHTGGLDGNFAWAGALCGLVFLGLLSFILFRGTVMMYMSLQGSVMVIFGLLGLIFKYQDVAPVIADKLQVQPLMLPIAVFIATVLGTIYQQAQYPPESSSGKS